jgi:N-acylneuraminate cytidylyltransferase
LAISKGAECPFLRPAEISTHSSGDIDFVKHALVELERSGYRPDLIIHLRPTTPFRQPSVIEQAILQAKENETWSAIRSVHEMSESAYKSFEIQNDGKLVSTFLKDRNLEKSNFARQAFPVTYQPNGYVDVLSVENIFQSDELHGSAVQAFITEPVIEIDSIYDLDLAETISIRRPELRERLFGN